MDEQFLDTALQHFGEEEKIKGAVAPPIFQNSLFVFPTYEDLAASLEEAPWGPPFHYSRISNPTMDLVERKLAFLEKTERAKVFGSGMAAISTAIMSCVQSGSHVVCVDTCYSNVRQMFDTYLPKFGISTTYVEGTEPQEFVDAMRPETSLVYMESPSTLFFKLQNVEAVTRVTRERRIPTILDNSYATPLYQQPAAMGVDIVVHSATKYLGGHSDITAGVVCTSSERMKSLIKNEVLLFGSALAPLPAWLLLRGMRTLSIRLRRHEETANILAAWLERSAHVDRVHHVGLDSYPQRELYKKQMSGCSGLFSFEPAKQDRDYVARFINSLKVFQIGISWGGFESLCVGLQLTPMDYPEPRWLIRLYCGLEDPRDLQADLEQAFAAAERG